MNDPLTMLILAALTTAIGSWLFWPDRGLYWRWRRVRQMSRRVLIEDALKHIHDCEYHNRLPSVQSLAGVLQVSVNEVTELVKVMQTHELIDFDGSQLDLTSQGRDYALHVIRAHRLWERYLADKTGYAEAEWHHQSEYQEHRLTPRQTDALANELGNPSYDPHGDPIPTRDGKLVALERSPLPNFPLDRTGCIVHLEDEPGAVYAQLIAEGLHLGMTVRITEITPQRIRFWANGDEHTLAPIVAANISLVPIPQEDVVKSEPFATLNTLKAGQTARVAGISPTCRGAERRRLLDLGILPGTTIKAEMVSPSGDPTAYLIRGALIGLRREQASLINITRAPQTETTPAMEALL